MKTQPRARLEGGHRVPRRGRADAVPRAAAVPPRRLRLHDLHRQQRPAARAESREAIDDERPGRRRGAVAATATSKAASTPTCARTTWRRRRWSSPTRWPAASTSTSTTEPLGDGQGRQAGLPAGHLADAQRGAATPSPRRSSRRCSSRRTRDVFEGDERWRKLRRAARARRYAWDDDVDLHQAAAVLRRHDRRRRRRSSDIKRRARAGAARRQHHHRPHLAGGLDQEGRPGRAST